MPATRKFGQSSKQHRVVVDVTPAAEDPHRIDLHVGFPHPAPHFHFLIPAVIIAAIGKQDQRLARMRRLFHVGDRQRHAVQQRRFPFGLRRQYLFLDPPRLCVKGDTSSGRSLNSTRNASSSGFADLKNSTTAFREIRQLPAHTAAGIEYDPDRERRILAPERYDLLLRSIFENLEIFCLEPGHHTRSGSSTVTGTSARFDSTRMWPSAEAGAHPGVAMTASSSEG